MGSHSVKHSLVDLYPGISDYIERQGDDRKFEATNEFKWWSRIHWEIFYFKPLRKEGGFSQSELQKSSIARIFELKEALSQENLIQGYIMDCQTKTDGDSGPNNPSKRKPMPTSFPDVLALREHLNSERGFGDVLKPEKR